MPIISETYPRVYYLLNRYLAIYLSIKELGIPAIVYYNSKSFFRMPLLLFYRIESSKVLSLSQAYDANNKAISRIVSAAQIIPTGQLKTMIFLRC